MGKNSGQDRFQFSVKKAQEQGYYKEIKYYPIIKYNQEAADKAIAQKAVEILKEDLKMAMIILLWPDVKQKTG